MLGVENMKLDKVIQERRSTRKFSSKTVSKEDIYKLIESARLARKSSAMVFCSSRK